MKEFDPSKRDASGTFKLTADTGSPRYMAPEVALDQPYNELADVYSFCILMWEMLELETPYSVYTSVKVFHNRVYQNGVRPKCNPKWPSAIADLLRAGWGPLSARPSMEAVEKTIREEMALSGSFRDGEIIDNSRKSESSFRGLKDRKSFVSAHALQQGGGKVDL